MKETDLRKKLNMAEMAPVSTFGHLGFTGTAAFADPENNIIFIFVSNRTYTGKNLLNTRDYRSRIHNIIYKALEKSGVLIT
jgi:CubicO group peptidase (beta-lactamase class C family)